MKVLHVIPGIAPRYGGPSQAVIQMCQPLRSEEVEVLIATTDADGEARLAVEIGRPVVYEGVPTIFFPRQLSEAFKYSHLLACWLDKNVEDFDVVHIHAVFSHSSLAAARACENKNVPYIVRPLGQIELFSEWVLFLDADYVLTPEVVEEMRTLEPAAGVKGLRAHFIYCVAGKRLRGSAYPPVTVLYRHKQVFYRQDGHAHRVVVQGEVQDLRWPILHDDRKSLSRWLRSQDIYMQQELSKLSNGNGDDLGLPDRLRKTRVLFPFVIFFYCLIVRGAIRDGWAGVSYAFQRMLAEILLALYLIEEDLRERRGQRSEVSGTDVSDQRSEVGTGGEAG